MTADHLGSARVITNQNGAVTTRKDYMAFGDEATSAQRSTSLNYDSSETRKGYTGYEKDTESGLEFAQARYYNSIHGRFTSVDPLTASATIKNPQTFNRYSYVLNSPYKFNDPLGLISSSTGACGSWCPGNGSSLPGGGGGYSSNYDSGQRAGIEGSRLEEERKIIEWALGIARRIRQMSSVASSPSPLPPTRTVALAAKVSKSQSEENAFLNRANQATSEVEQFSNGLDILSALREFSESGPIDIIRLHDHGFVGGIVGDGENIGFYTMEQASKLGDIMGPPSWITTEDFANQVKDGNINIAKGGSIILYGCNNSEFAKELSLKLGGIGRTDITVVGANNFVYEKNGSAHVDGRTTGISAGKAGWFISYKNGNQMGTSVTWSYK